MPDERDIAAGATHVEGDDVVPTGDLAEPDCGGDAAGGAGKIVETPRSAVLPNGAEPPLDCMVNRRATATLRASSSSDSRAT